MKIIGHKAEKVDTGLHALGIEPSEVPIVRGKGKTNAIARAIGCAHFFEKQSQVLGVCEFATASLRVTGVFPVQINSRKAVFPRGPLSAPYYFETSLSVRIQTYFMNLSQEAIKAARFAFVDTMSLLHTHQSPKGPASGSGFGLTR
jgi:hypothetical protein